MRERWMVSDCDLKSDLEGILEIEKVFGRSGWTRQMFVPSIERSNLTWLFVAKSRKGNRVEGYCAAVIVMEDLEVHRIAVRQSGRRQGIGSALILETLRRGQLKGANNVFLDVRDSNVDAQRFYEKFGFRRAAVRLNYYSNPREDALVLRRSIKVLKADNGCDTVKM